MHQKEKFEITKRLILSLIAKLKAFNGDSTKLSKFIEELENMNFSMIHQDGAKNLLSKKILRQLKSMLLKLNLQDIEGLGNQELANFNWTNVYDGVSPAHSFINGMFVSRLAGLEGYYVSDRISVGLMLILPGVIYPFHAHHVNEFYYCLSGKLLIQHDFDGKKFSLTEGEISITPKGALHLLEVNEKKPVLLLYSWLGNLNASVRVWEKTESGLWKGFIWKRLPGEEFKSRDIQTLSNIDFLKSYGKPD